MIKYLIKNVHLYRRLKIELDLLDKELGEEYPIIREVTEYLRKPPYNIPYLRNRLRGNHGTNNTSDNTDSS